VDPFRRASPPRVGDPGLSAPVRVSLGTASPGLLQRAAIPHTRWAPDGCALAAITVAALGYLLPALLHGASFGPTDLGQQLSLLTNTAAPVHNNLNGDVITQSLPWEALNWRLVHHGELPLWNPLSGNGMPLYLNFESASLALPTLVSYLAPLVWSLMVAVAVKLLIAGWGTYLCCRVLGLAPLPSTFAAVTFMLSGPVTGWLGWSSSGVFIWCGAIVAGAALCYHGSRPRLGVGILSLSVAAAIYAGFPEGDLLLGAGLLGLIVVPWAAVMRRDWRIHRRGVMRAAAAGLLGVGLGAPLWWPGLAVLNGSARLSITQALGLPPGETALTVAQGYCGLPTGAHQWFCAGNYYETAAYVGPLCLALAALAVLTLRKRPLVVGLGASIAVVLLVVYTFGPFDPVQAVIRHTPLRAVDLDRMLPVLAFGLAVLAALGLDAVLASIRRGDGLRALPGALAVIIAIVAVLWLSTFWGGLARAAEADRWHSLVWPSALLAFATGTLLLTGRRRWRGRGQPRAALVGVVLIVAQAAFLIDAGAGINSSAPVPVPASSSLDQLRGLVGTGLLGIAGGNTTCAGATTPACGFRQWTGAGLYPEMNILIGLPELAVHDPAVPDAYLKGWPVPSSGQTTDLDLDLNFFFPDVDTVHLAQLYGVTAVVVPAGVPVPAGMDQIAKIRGMTVLRVPGSSRFTISRPDTTIGVPATQPADNKYVMTVPIGGASTLVARVTDVPGWTATAEGARLPIRRTANDLMQIDVPSSARTIVLTYLPRGLLTGGVIGLMSLLVLAGYGLLGLRRGRPGV